MRNIKLQALAFGVAAALSASVQADQILITPGVSYYFNDSERNLKNTEAYSIGLEYVSDDRWAFEALLLGSQPDFDDDVAGLDEPDHLAYQLDGKYYFGQPGDRLTPYVAVGIGEAQWDYDRIDHVETQINFGGGVRYEIAPNTTLRADARVIHGIDDETFDETLSLGISYAFDMGSPKAKPAPAPAPEPVAVAPVEEAAPVDSDGDGVMDPGDKCPNTRAGAKVDQYGCELVKTTVETIRLNVQFPNASAAVGERYMAEIQKVADFMKKYPDTTVVVEGHTDSVGNEAFNQRLSENRANAVREVLVSRFNIESARAASIGYGETKPVATNDTAAGRQQNRRVVAVLQKETAVPQQ